MASGLRSSVGAAASASKGTTLVTVLVEPSFSVDVAATLRVKSACTSKGTMMPRPSSAASSGVNVQVPSSFLVPKVRNAPSGRPLMVMDKLSDSSMSVNAASMSSTNVVGLVAVRSPSLMIPSENWKFSTLTTVSVPSRPANISSTVKVPSEFSVIMY